MTDQLGLKVVGAYIEGRSQQFINFAELNENLFEVPGAYHDQQSSGEAQLNFHNDLVKAVGGVFYMDSTACGSYNASIGTLSGTLPPTVAPPLGSTSPSWSMAVISPRATAVYGDTAWRLTDRLNLDAGVRWNEDQVTARVYQNDYTSLAPTQLLPGQQLFNPATVPVFNPATGAGFIPDVVTNYTGNRTFVNVSPRLGFDYHFTDHVMGYVSYSRGFKSGGFDMRGNAAVFPGTENGYNSETADNYEVGLKTTLLDDTLLFNLTLFYNPYSNAQIQLQDFVEYDGKPTNLTAVLNAGKQINQGVELESVWRPTRPLTLSLNVGYLDSYYKNFLINCAIFTFQAGCGPRRGRGEHCRRESAAQCALLDVSENTIYTWDLPSGSLLARAGVDWRSFTKVAVYTPSPTDQPAYRPAQCRPRVHHHRQGVALLDRRQEPERTGTTASPATTSGLRRSDPPISYIGGVSQIGFYGPPRTVTATVTYHF